MESTNQDELLHPSTGGATPTPPDGVSLDESYDPTDLSGDANRMPATPTDEEEAATGNDGTGAVSGRPNMEPDTRNYGNGDTLGNNDGTEDDPEATDPSGSRTYIN